MKVFLFQLIFAKNKHLMRMTKNCPDDSVRVRQWRTFLTGTTAPCIACPSILSYFAPKHEHVIREVYSCWTFISMA